MKLSAALRWFLTFLVLAPLIAAPRLSAAKEQTMRVLFIGNSYTARHTLSALVKSMAEAGHPERPVEVATVIYGGRTLKDHWRLGTQNVVRFAVLARAEQLAMIEKMRGALAKDPADSNAQSALRRHEDLLKSLETPRQNWDVVVLQSYRDDLAGDASSYVEYAPQFAAIAKAQGARVLLYETTPVTQNAQPLTLAPDPAPIRAKARMLAKLARSIDAKVVPMSMVALECQTVRPDLTLRFINDGHLNHTMAYLTACTFYATLFDRSPEGLSIATVTDTRFLDDANKDKDRDGQPITRTYSPAERTQLQRIAWAGYRKYCDLK